MQVLTIPQRSSQEAEWKHLTWEPKKECINAAQHLAPVLAIDALSTSKPSNEQPKHPGKIRNITRSNSHNAVMTRKCQLRIQTSKQATPPL